jgi:hypothetical protein
MRYFTGQGRDFGHVSASQHATFADLCEALSYPVVLPQTRAAFQALPTRERQLAKRVQYVVPAAFADTPIERKAPHAIHCNLIALDIDDSTEAKRLLEQGWDGLGDLGFIVWHTASSTPQAPRIRVLVSAEKIPPGRYAAAVRTVAEMLGLSEVTRESLVPVQPMFWPTIFCDDPEIAPVAQAPEGVPFTLADIIDGGEASLQTGEEESPTPSPDQNGVADLSFLRTPLENVTLEDAKGALEKLDPDMPMQQWIEVAAGLKHQFGGGGEESGEGAYEIWDEWSAKGKKYVDSAETAYRWKTLKAQPTDRNPITIRSIFKAASARGWVNTSLAKRGYAEALAWIKSDMRSTEELLDQAVPRIARTAPMIGGMEKKALLAALRDKLKSRDVWVTLPDLKKEVRKLEVESAKTTGVPPWSKGLCFVTALGKFYRYTTGRMFTPEVIDLMYSTPSIGEETPMRPRDYLMQVVGIQQVENLRYDPARGTQRFFTDENVPYVNIYRPTYATPDPHRAEEAGAMIREHIANLIREPEYQLILIDYMAYLVQHPGKKITWAMLLQGVKGAGKTFLAVLMRAALGGRNISKLTGTALLDGTHNDWAYGRQLVVIEEVRVIGHNRYAVMDKLKPCITDDEIDLHCKFEPHRTVPNITNYMMFTNYHDALAVDDSERRYFVLASALQTVEDLEKLGGADYFNRLFSMVQDNPGGCRSFLEQWAIDPLRFNPKGRAPMTRYLHELAINAASPLTAAVQEVIAEQPSAHIMRDLLSFPALRETLDLEHRLGNFSDQALASVLREAGWAKIAGARVSVSGRKHQLWSHGFRGDAAKAARVFTERDAIL